MQAAHTDTLLIYRCKRRGREASHERRRRKKASSLEAMDRDDLRRRSLEKDLQQVSAWLVVSMLGVMHVRSHSGRG